jgi:hypothetical protein
MILFKRVFLAAFAALLAPVLAAQTTEPLPEKPTASSLLGEAVSRVPSEMGRIFSYLRHDGSARSNQH